MLKDVFELRKEDPMCLTKEEYAAVYHYEMAAYDNWIDNKLKEENDDNKRENSNNASLP